MQQLRRHTHLGTNTTTNDRNNINDNDDIQYMDLKEPAQDNVTKKTVVQKQEAYDAMLVAMDEYEHKIERLEKLNATLTANVQTLTSAALDGGGDTNEIDDNITNRQRSTSMDISPNEEYNNQEDNDDDMILTEDHYINKISKLQRQNQKKDKQMEHKKKLVSQLSMNLKTAAEKISEFSRERDEWKAKYEEQSTTSQNTTNNNDEESTKQIHNYQIQVIQNELSTLLHTIQTNNKSNSKHREHLLNEYRNDDTTISMEKPEDTLKRVIRHLRNGDDDDDSVTLEKSKKYEIERGVAASQQTGGGVNIWDSVTSIFGRGGGLSQQEEILEQQKQDHIASAVDYAYDDDKEKEEDIELPESEDIFTTLAHEDHNQSIESPSSDIIDNKEAPQSVEDNDETNTEEENTISPQEYFIKSILQAKGYPGTTFSSLKGGYYNTPTMYQTSSYGVALTKAIRSSDISTVQSLLDAGLHPNACNEFGESVLHAACRRGDYAMIQVLIEADASVQVVDDFGRSPLHDAFWTVSPNYEIIQLLMDQDPWLLCLMDSRGSTPLEYVRKEHWNIWIDFLRDTADRYWPNVNNDKRQDDDVVHPKEPPLAFIESNSRPLSNPKEIALTYLEPIELIANGTITLQDLTKEEEEEEHDKIADDDNAVDYVNEDGDRVDTISNNETEKSEQEEVISAEGGIAEEVSCKDEQVEEPSETDNIVNQRVDKLSIDDTSDQSDTSTEEREYKLEDQIIGSASVSVDQQVDNDYSEKEEDMHNHNTYGSEETASAEKVTQHGTILLPQYAESHDAIESVYGIHTAYEDQPSQNEELEQDIDNDYETDDDNYIAKEPKDDNDDNNSQEGEQLEELVDEINSDCEPSEVVESSNEDALEPDVVSSKYQEMDAAPSQTIEVNSEIPEPVSSCQDEQQVEEDETGNEASQACLVDDDETLNELSDIPTSINVLPKNHRSDVSTVMTSATAITDGTQARVTAAGESKVLAETLDKVKEQLDIGIDGDRSIGNYHSVVSQYTSSSKLLQDETLQSRLSRKQLYNRQGSLTTEDLLNVEDGAKDINSLGDRQVLVTSTDNEKYMVPRYKPPTMPPETNTDALPFKKGLPDGYYTYKSSSGNDYSGQWKAGKRSGVGRAKYRQGEVYHGQWELGRRSGHGCLYLVNTDVYDGGWKLNKKHGLGAYYWADGEVDISWYEHDVRKESVRWTKDRRRAYALDLATSKKEQISLVRAANKIKEWEFKSQTL